MSVLASLTDPAHLYSREMVLSRPCPVPKARGIYAWFFRETPGITPAEGCVTKNGMNLLYVGISPTNDRSTQTLRTRIAYHYRGNAEGSTLRLTLGILLEDRFKLPLRRVGSGGRMTFTHLGEQCLDEWMSLNAFVCWIEHSQPWEVEAQIFQSLSLPLNIQDNSHHPFSDKLKRLRSFAKQAALREPIANEDDQRRTLL